jgi:Domain of unknown function (DUF4277)
VAHLPMINAYADTRDLIGLIHSFVPTEMGVDASTIVLSLVWDTLSGRSPLYRVEECLAHQDTERRLGKPGPPHAVHDDTVGRGLDRLYDMNTMQILTACAVRTAARFGVGCRAVHVETTSRPSLG